VSTPATKLADAIRAARRERVAVVSFLTAGYPSKQGFRDDLIALAAQSDVVEIGIPFTDPMADGVTVQRSSFEALKNGVTLKWIIEAMAGLPKLKAQLVFMGYYNPMLAYGVDRLAVDAARVGVTGFIIPDLPLEESASFERAIEPLGLAFIRMVTPVTPRERLDQICSSAKGFVYAVSMKGTTGNRAGGGEGIAPETLEYLDKVRKLSPVPVCVGFGIRERSQVEALDPHVDGIVVASVLIEAQEKGESPVVSLKRLFG
jgi:tryptophan synthase alpha chain